MPRRIDMRGMTRKEWRHSRMYRHVQPPVHHRADMPPQVDEDELRREAEAARQLMEQMK